MTEIPIMFTAPGMIPAILDGRKTQTRRLNKLREFGPSSTRGYDWTFRDKRGLWNDFTTEKLLTHARPRRFAPYHVGDRLWVKEPFSLDALSVYPCPPVWYRADFWKYGDDPANGEHARHCKAEKTGTPEGECFACWGKFRWKSPIFIPRRLSRITLEVTRVRVERLHDISEDDARAEGVRPEFETSIEDFFAKKPVTSTHALGFKHAWREIHGAESWDSNPWVWAITFKRITP